MKLIKKSLKLSLISTSLLALNSCSISEVESYVGKNFLPRNKFVTSLVNLTSQEYLDKVTLLSSNHSSSNNFLVMIYSLNCQTCQKVESYIAQLAKQDNVLIYGINYTTYKNELYDIYSKDSNYNSYFPYIASYPTFIYYSNKDGKVNAQVNPLVDSYYQSLDYFTIALHRFFSDERIYYLNNITSSINNDSNFVSIDYTSYLQLKEFINSKRKIAVFFVWNRCIDCANLYSNFLFEFSKNYSGEIYCFETSYFRQQKNENPSIWNEFQSEFGLNSENINGWVPSLIYYENSQIKKAIRYEHNSQEEIDEITNIYSLLLD